MKIRTETVENRSIFIIDEVFSKDEIDAFYEYVKGLSFVRHEVSTSYDQFPIFSVDFTPDKFETTFVGSKSKEILANYIKIDDYFLSRAYINMSTYGDVEFPHRDCVEGKEDYTVLYYVNNIWNYKFGGETLFYSNKDSRLAVLPTPGRFLIFPGSIEHIGGVASRICKEPRLSLALKYRLKN